MFQQPKQEFLYNIGLPILALKYLVCRKKSLAAAIFRHWQRLWSEETTRTRPSRSISIAL